MQSCNESLSELNEDPNSYYTTVPSTLVTYAQKNLADYVNTPNVNINNLRLLMQYWQETTYLDESRYDFVTRNVSNSVWTYNYVRTLKNLSEAKKLINTYSPTPSEVTTWETTKKNQLAIVDLLMVYSYQILVDTHGNIPYTQALDVDTFPLPAYDDAKTIYADLITRTQADIAALDVTGTSFSTGEVYYNGNVGKWKKFGNSLLLKLGIALADENPGLAQSTVNAAIAGGVFSSKADDCNIAYLGASPNWNPLYDNLVASNRNDYVAGKTIVDQMNTTTDSRRSAYFAKNLHYSLGKVVSVSGNTINFTPASPAPPVAPVVGDEVFKGKNSIGTIASIGANSITLVAAVPSSVVADDALGFSYYYNGGTIGMSSPFSTYTNVGTFGYTSTTPGILLNYTEVAFYLAEASARWGIGGATAPLYNNAVAASFLQWGYTAGDATSYLAAHPYDANNWKQSIGVEAWVAMYNQPMQGWNFYRRLDYPVLQPAQNAVTPANNKVPVRMQYPVSEQTTNPSNYEAGSSAIGGDFLYTKIFWDKN